MEVQSFGVRGLGAMTLWDCRNTAGRAPCAGWGHDAVQDPAMCVCVGGVLGGCSRGLPCPLAAPSRPRTPRMAAAAVCSRACERRSPFLSSSSSSSPRPPPRTPLRAAQRHVAAACERCSIFIRPARPAALQSHVRAAAGARGAAAALRRAEGWGGGAGRCGGTPQYVWVCVAESPVRGTGVCVCCCKRGRVGAGTYVCVCVGVCGCVHAAGLHPPTLQGCVCEPCACMCSVCVCVHSGAAVPACRGVHV